MNPHEQLLREWLSHDPPNGLDEVRKRVNYLIIALDRLTTVGIHQTIIFAWALGRWADLLGIPKELLHELVDRAYDTSRKITQDMNRGGN